MSPSNISSKVLPIIPDPDDEWPTCKCGKPGQPDHTCPYASDINDDHETLCNCCDDCCGECADDI